MANMHGVGLEIFKAGGDWRDQKWAPSWSVKLPSFGQGRVQTLPLLFGQLFYLHQMCGEFSVYPLFSDEGRLCVYPAQQTGYGGLRQTSMFRGWAVFRSFSDNGSVELTVFFADASLKNCKDFGCDGDPPAWPLCLLFPYLLLRLPASQPRIPLAWPSDFQFRF
ncbi:hypothetical protein T4B_2246 [Trichinella pseudospiralis]|uniref:Uncharacterized protein n=1 Tax=Trichinella pseudospiralis TaxID=6337 RepID=A0A0V1GW68_TRIPS|nr:hypothetical protein T4B_2246 [Trichinella pseudospiralis]